MEVEQVVFDAVLMAAGIGTACEAVVEGVVIMQKPAVESQTRPHSKRSPFPPIARHVVNHKDSPSEERLTRMRSPSTSSLTPYSSNSALT